MELKAARALPPQNDQLMWQGDTLEFQRRSAANRNESMETRADRMVIRGKLPWFRVSAVPKGATPSPPAP
jgi:hypothetical protein